MANVNGVPSAQSRRFVVDPSESGVLIEARSTAGNITFGTNAITGYLDAADFDGLFLTSPSPHAELTVDLRTLRSGNSLYDAELAHRLDVRRYPEATITLVDMKPVDQRYQVSGEVTLHGETQQMSGSVSAEPCSGGWIVSGQQLFDVRDFQISVPSVLMLRIFPDVMVFLSLKLAGDSDAQYSWPAGA